MDMRASLGKVRTWLWLCLMGSVATVFQYTLENSKPPKWLASLIQWIFGVSSDTFNALVAKTFPLWSALFLGVLMVLICSAAIGVLAKNYRSVKTRLEHATFSNSELIQANDNLNELNSDLVTKIAELNASSTASQKTTERLKGELDAVQKELKRLKDNAKTIPFNMDSLITANAFTPPTNSSLLPKSLRLLNRNETSHDAKSKILKAVMLCTRTETYGRFESIKELVNVKENELRKLLKSLESDGYIKISSYGSMYQLTPEAKMHFKSLENNIHSELKFS